MRRHHTAKMQHAGASPEVQRTFPTCCSCAGECEHFNAANNYSKPKSPTLWHSLSESQAAPSALVGTHCVLFLSQYSLGDWQLSRVTVLVYCCPLGPSTMYATSSSKHECPSETFAYLNELSARPSQKTSGAVTYMHVDCKHIEPLKFHWLAKFCHPLGGGAHWSSRFSWQAWPGPTRGLHPLPSSGQKVPLPHRGGSG